MVEDRPKSYGQQATGIATQYQTPTSHLLNTFVFLESSENLYCLAFFFLAQNLLRC
ncbi:hypothetical protein HRE53_30415 (plasmid) [Acaryochloris sp. 'Moss Beach']|uniref:hypothetical protein n=1 Tax=Acaryochloris sp. 'Moss Beach' TaxID=2740837 RepID=UPI001F1FA212|nr:hypothetical protein [Acaryochloris sp. 'Moss Beach']UJB72910.1 hypothetical protein HRE53_30415 [Acaryochloris sp. 'Moss Beach']